MGRKKHTQNISELEKKYAKILYQRGMSQTRIALQLRVSSQAITNLKKKDGDWDEFRLPPITAHDLLDNLQHILAKMQIEALSEKNIDLETMTRFTLNFNKLTSSLKDIQELLEVVDIKNKMLSMQDFMRWLVGKSFNSPEEAAQTYHDEQGEKL